MTRLTAAAVVFALGVAPALAGDAWTDFRGATQQGHAVDADPPVEWSTTKNVTWKTAIPGVGWSSPVVLGEQVWMTTALNSGHDLYAICVHRDTGELLHSVRAFRVADPGDKHQMNSFASPTPALEPGRVYVHFGTHGTAAIDTATGKVVWTNDQLRQNHLTGPGSSPILYKDKLIVHCDAADVRYVVALDKKTGRVAWKTDRSNHVNGGRNRRRAFCTPVLIDVDGETQLISPAADALIAYDPDTGQELWQVRYEGYSLVARPVVGDGMIYMSTGFDVADFVAIAVPRGKRGDVTRSNLIWRYEKRVPKVPSPLLVDGRLYLVGDAGVLTVLDAMTGTPVYIQRLGGRFAASPLYAGGRIYLFDRSGKTTVLAPGDSFKVIATNDLGEPHMASPAVVGDTLFLRTERHLYQVESKSSK